MLCLMGNTYSNFVGYICFQSPEEWGEFLHLPGQKIFDFAEIETEIIRETDRATGRNKVYIYIYI